jgi:hypothetical protein
VHESPLPIDAALQEDAMEMGIPSHEVSRRGVGDHCGTLGPPARGRAGEALDHAVDELADLAEEQGALLGASRTQAVQWPAQGMEHLAAEGAPILGLAVRVNAFQAVLAQPCGELNVVSPEEVGKMGGEEPLQRACAPLAVGARGRRIQGQRQLVCHA